MTNQENNIDMVSIIQKILRYKKLFVFSLLFFIVLYWSFYVFSLRKQVQYSKTLIVCTDLPVTALSLAAKLDAHPSMKTVFKRSGNLFTLVVTSKKKEDVDGFKEKFLKKIQDHYVPLFEKREHLLLSKLSHQQISSAVFKNYNVTTIFASPTNKMKKFSLKKNVIFFLAFFFLIISLDLAIIFIIEFIKLYSTLQKS